MTEQEFIQQAEGLKGRLYRTAWLYLGSEACAVDAVDEAVYQGFLHYKRLRQPEYFATWMTRILINACNAELRRRKRELAVAELPETAAEAFDALPLREAVARCPVSCGRWWYCATSRASPWRRPPRPWTSRRAPYPPASVRPCPC